MFECRYATVEEILKEFNDFIYFLRHMSEEEHTDNYTDFATAVLVVIFKEYNVAFEDEIVMISPMEDDDDFIDLAMTYLNADVGKIKIIFYNRMYFEICSDRRYVAECDRKNFMDNSSRISRFIQIGTAD